MGRRGGREDVESALTCFFDPCCVDLYWRFGRLGCFERKLPGLEGLFMTAALSRMTAGNDDGTYVVSNDDNMLCK